MIKQILSIAFATGIALLSIGAFYWPEELGYLSASPATWFILLAILLYPFVRNRQRNDRIADTIILMFFLSLVGSFFSFIIFGFENVFVKKFITLGILSIIWISPMMLINCVSTLHLKVGILVGITICCSAYLFSDLLNVLPQAFLSFIFSKEFQNTSDLRPRGFCEEASHFSITFSRLILAYYAIAEAGKKIRINHFSFSMILLSVFLVILASKGAVVGISVSILAIAFNRRYARYLIIIFPLAFYILNSQSGALVADFEKFSSIATRGTLIFTGIAATLSNPIGWGSYGFYGIIEFMGKSVAQLVSDRVTLDLFETDSILSELKNVSTKSTLIDFSSVFGWCFIFLMAMIMSSINLKDYRARVIFIFGLLTSFSSSGHLSISFFLLIAILVRFYPRMS